MSCRTVSRRTVSRRTVSAGNVLALSVLALTVLALGAAAVPAAAAGGEVCDGYDQKQRISRLGGRAAFSKNPVASPADLREQLDAHRAEVEALMAEKGLGNLTDALYAAVAGGDGLSERDLERGEVFQWMAFRKRSGPAASGPLCFAAKKTYDAYVVEVTEADASMAKAACALKVSGGSCVGDPFVVDTAGSSKGVKVETKGPDASGNTPGAPGTYNFTATAQTRGTKKVTTHNFVIPKVCLNLAYIGMTSKEMEGAVDSCSESARVEVPDCRVSLAMTADPTEVRRNESIQVDVSGTYDQVQVVFKDKDGNAVEAQDAGGNAVSELTGSGAVSFKKAGTYTMAATASRCNGRCRQTETAETVVTVKPGWTARFFGLRLDPDDGSIHQDTIRPNGVSERSLLTLDSGIGAGAGLEYHFTPRVGLEGSLLYVPLGSIFMFDLDNAWETDDDDSDMLAFLLGPNFHLTPDKKVDLYFGPFVGIVDLGGTSYQVLGETHNRSLDADTVFGVQLGLDIPFGAGDWAIHLGARYMDMTIETSENGPEIAADPLGLEVGFAYRF